MTKTKNISAKLFLFLLCIFSNTMQAQDNLLLTGDENSLFVNDSHYPCISASEYAMLNKQCDDNIKLLGLDKNLHKNALTTSLNWPIHAATGFTDCDFYFIGAYVDQNTGTGVFNDYDCGTNTYDGHHGTDIAAWPYGFYKMERNQVEVIAAAPGTIIQKADGYQDRNCGTNSLTANSIIIQHADGSQALYWHMKSNSLTTKTIGQTVVAGEYLGVVGSSGSSSGPHLHFEVWTGSTNTTYNDPFAGTCNTLNASSWWNVQRPHTNPAVIKVSTHTTDYIQPACPTTEVPNEADTFAIPFQGPGLSQGYAKFYIFIRDDVTGMTADCKILNPNGSTFNSWTYTSTANNKAYYRGYSKLLPTIPGNYKFQATYNGSTCFKNFVITLATGISLLSQNEQIQVLNNPANGTFEIFGENINNGNYKITLLNVTGQVASEENVMIGKNIIHKIFPVSQLTNGFYFISISNQTSRVVRKLVIQN